MTTSLQGLLGSFNPSTTAGKDNLSKLLGGLEGVGQIGSGIGAKRQGDKQSKQYRQLGREAAFAQSRKDRRLAGQQRAAMAGENVSPDSASLRDVIGSTSQQTGRRQRTASAPFAAQAQTVKSQGLMAMLGQLGKGSKSILGPWLK